MKRALVTGASGFVGPYLVRHLLQEGYEVVAGVHFTGERRLSPSHSRLNLDVTDREDVRRAIAEVQPDEIYHLAGLTRPASGAPEEIYRVNFLGTLNLLEAARERAPEASVLVVGSAYAYGKRDEPVAESEALRPVDHYGASKGAADLLAHGYATQGLRVTCVRPFNHSGPGQSVDFLLPALVHQFAEIVAGKREPVVRLGNLNSVRDFSDVRDIVRAYQQTLQSARFGEAYNLGSGRGVSVRQLFEMVRREAGTEVELVSEPSRVRSGDIPYLVANTEKARRELGWEARVPLSSTIGDMLKAGERRSSDPPRG